MSTHFDDDRTQAIPVSQVPTETFAAAAPGPAFAAPEAEQRPWYQHPLADPAAPAAGPSADFTQRAQNGFTAGERAARSGRPVLSGAESVTDDRSTWPHALADGMAVGSLILSLLGFGVIGIVLGAIHASNAHKLRQRSSAVGAWGIGIGIAGTLAWILLIIVIIAAGVAASHASYSTGYYGS